MLLKHNKKPIFGTKLDSNNTLSHGLIEGFLFNEYAENISSSFVTKNVLIHTPPNAQGRVEYLNKELRVFNVNGSLQAWAEMNVDVLGGLNECTIVTEITIDNLTRPNRIFGTGSGMYQLVLWVEYVGTPRFRAHLRTNTKRCLVEGNAVPISIDKKYVLILVYDGVDCSLYVNTVFAGSDTLTGTIVNDTSAPFYLGRILNDTSSAFGGSMNCAYFYNRALNKEEIDRISFNVFDMFKPYFLPKPFVTPEPDITTGNSINHYNNFIHRLPTCRAWRGKIIRAVFEVISEQIKLISNELIQISHVKNILFGQETEVSTLLNDELYTLGSTHAMIGEQVESAGRVAIWEYILDLLPNGSIDDRMNAIINAIVNVGKISLSALEKTLQDNGYNVYVYPNGGGVAPGSRVTYSSTTTYGGTIGYPGAPVRYVPPPQSVDPTTIPHELCVNFIDESEDQLLYGAGYSNDSRRWEFGFFIGGENYLDYANIDISKKAAFRELILRSKPGSMWAFLLVNYV